MDKFSHIYIVGCSYMNSYVEARPHNQLRQYFGGEITDITWGGSGYDYHERELMTALLEDVPHRALVLFGLSYWHRFELAYRDSKNVKYMQFNPSRVMNDHDFGTYYPDLSDLPDRMLQHRTRISEPYIENILQRLITLSGWLKSRNHTYIIFNQTDDLIQKYIKSKQIYNNYFSQDSGFVDLSSFKMLDWLKNNSVEFDSDGHPSTKPESGETITKFFINYYETNLK